ncbi:hypothetical protein BP6252_07444 [Coleophoma cylindrospora]|uniref:DUF1772-domain-containing protein n=1 Tax=Coleophoma cylindrospora TaxID=1849047 RepID=A0A3D8RHM0_9HELO|nr:hypothetical protein BP6252_07444 [Coleophoma cylindrospora]
MDPAAILRTTTLLGLSSSFFISGINFSASQLTLPALYGLQTSASTAAFDILYHRGATALIPLVSLTTVLQCTSAYLDPENRIKFAIAAGLTLAPLPWTRLVMMETIQQLLKLAGDATTREKVGKAQIVSLLRTWTWMNFARSAMAAAGGFIGVAIVAGKM